MRGCLVERNVDYSNRVSSSKKVNAKQMKREEIHQKENMPFSSQEYAEKLQKENMTLMKALAHRNKIIELSGVEFQKLRINLRNVQEKNLQLAQANSQMLAELNTNRDRLKQFQHELGCKNGLLNAMKMQLEEQILPCIHHGSKDKVPANVSDGDCKPFQTQDLNHTKRKRTSRIKPSGSSNDKPIHTNENTNSKRQCVRRQSTRFAVQETEQTEKLLEMGDAQETEEATRPSLRRRSARLRPEEGETCKSIHERDEVRETIKRRRVSSRQQSARFNFQEPEVTETLNADDAGSLVSEESFGSRSEAVEPSENRHDAKQTDGKRRVSMRRQSTKGKSQAVEATKEIATDPYLGNNIVQDCDDETKSKNKPRGDENEGMIRRTSVGRPSRHAAEKVQSYREVSLKVKMRRKC
ncbi:SHUGOSHIN 2 [Cardamine amara subsp. amara]|uniref:SHUGOSHIN 2 n=1 Tax=Cardamine amara subsp. amara TaxID=228776 RepID=A0ABD1A420_CARAN